MDDMRWAWVLFVAASLAVLIRLAMWFLPAPGWHSEQVEQAVAPLPAAASAEPDAEVPAAEAAWPDETEDANGWPPAPAETAASAPPPPAPAPPAPPPEEFHLRRTRWGMSREEVRESEPGEPLRENERGLLYATTTHEMPCLLTYSFVQGRLVRARLSFSDPSGQELPPLTVAQAQRRFLYLREQLRGRYGEPVQKTVHMPRNVADLRRRAQKQEELAQQYDAEIAEAGRRLQKQREWLDVRYRKWPNRAELVARGLAPLERDLRELRKWKQEAIDNAAQSRQHIQKNQEADAAQPLVATMTARWPYARDLHDIELKLDFRSGVPRLDIRYEETPTLPDAWQMDEL